MTEQQDRILNNAIIYHGIDHQFDMFIEETGEILQAINKLRRVTPANAPFTTHPQPGTDVKYSLAYFGLCSEIADVKILLHQLEKIMSPEAIQLAMDRKIERLANRLGMVRLEFAAGFRKDIEALHKPDVSGALPLFSRQDMIDFANRLYKDIADLPGHEADEKYLDDFLSDRQ